MVHHSWKSPPAPNVQPAHQALEPVMSSHFRNRHPTFSFFSFSSLAHTHTLTCTKCHKWLLPREREAGKSTTQTLMKNKSQLNPTWKESQPNMHHSFLTANPLLAFPHPIVSSHTCACFLFCFFFTSYALSNPAVMLEYERRVTILTTDF